jgi:hypothetical protein
VAANFQSVARALRLLWVRMGAARFLVLLILGAVLALAAMGVWHLCSPRKPVASSPDTHASSTPSASAAAPAKSQRVLAITELTESRSRGRHGERRVVATIGLTPQADSVRGEVGIHVFFFDVTATNEIRPTDAQVTYEWITPVRDWNDATTKYLAATYMAPRHRSFWNKRLRYGGFLVRVYVGDTLQDEQSKPATLLTALRKGPLPNPSSAPTVDAVAAESATPDLAPPPSVASKLAANPPVASPTRSPAASIDPANTSLPYGKPVPGKPGFVSSPFDPKFIIDVRGFPPGTLVNDPNADKTFRVP